nr:unnamed protein product [Callosobruchus analis]
MGGGESNTGTNNGSSVVNLVNTGMRKFKLPRIESKQYDGDIKGWLAFWSQFKKVHEGSSIECCDKIEYLCQATVPGSRAPQLVESYPAMSENYHKIIESMSSRFGREDLQIEDYVRELLKLILSNSISRGVDISLLYDRLETQLRALETLGITSDKYAAILFPLIESCLPNELLRVWQRSTFNSPTSNLEGKLKSIMIFLQQEVEHEQRITLASEGFGIEDRKTRSCLLEAGAIKTGTKFRSFSKKASEVPTAAGLKNH